ncbi:MAG TPA: calcium-binding protein [Actinomycetota bacterium]|nr:calcium-binding protein [Actinomycetota bacterium]
MRASKIVLTVGVMAAMVVGGATAARAVPDCFGRTPTIVGTADDDKLAGTPGPDVIHALGGIDRVDGGRGDDVICLGEGGSEPSEILELARGGSGDDRISGGRGADVILGGPGDDRLEGGVGWDNIRAGWGRDRTTDSGGPNGYFYGGPGRDTMIGSDDRDQFSDDDGNDTIVARDGNDQIVLENGGAGEVDDVDGGAGPDIIWIGDHDAQEHLTIDLQAGVATGEALGTDNLTSIEDVLAWCDPCEVTGSDAANDVSVNTGVVRGLGGNDSLQGEEVDGGDGDDYLSGGFGDDDLRGGPGDDTFVPYEGDNRVDGGDGSDTIRYTQAVEVDLAAGTGTRQDGDDDDTLVSIENAWGSGAGDVIYGNDGDNVLFGDWPETGYGGGNDYIDGRGGTDTIDGVRGADVCVNGEDVKRCEP